MGFTAVIDLHGLDSHMLNSSAIELLKTCFSIDAAYYPEALHRVYLINCPSIITFAFRLVSGVVDKRTLDKLVFCSPEETLDTLRLVIDDDKIPEHLGGSCRCPGGCVVIHSSSSKAGTTTDGSTSGALAKSSSSAEVGQDGSAAVLDDAALQEGVPLTEDVKVKAGCIFTKTFDVACGDEVTWDFASTSGHDVVFSVDFLPDGVHAEAYQPHEAVVVVPPVKGTNGCSKYVCRVPTGGTVVLRWDNTHSWMKSKKLQLQVYKCTAPPMSSESSVNLGVPSPHSPHSLTKRLNSGRGSFTRRGSSSVVPTSDGK